MIETPGAAAAAITSDIVMMLANAGFADDLWVSVIASCEVGHMIPTPDIFEAVLEQTGASAEEAAFISTRFNAMSLPK